MLKSEHSKFKDLKYDKDMIYYGKEEISYQVKDPKTKRKTIRTKKVYTGKTVVVLFESSLLHIGVSSVNPRKSPKGKTDQFNSKRGREVALGRALRQMAVSKNKAIKRNSKNKRGEDYPKSLSLSVPKTLKPEEITKMAAEISDYLSTPFPEFLLGVETPKVEKKDVAASAVQNPGN